MVPLRTEPEDLRAEPDIAGHYPHAQSPDAVAELVIPFLKEHASA